MIEINLLPHREARRAADLRQTLAVLVLGLVLVAALVGFMKGAIGSDLKEAREQVAHLEAEIANFKPQLEQVEVFKKKRSELKEKLAVINNLDRSRSGPVRLMDEMTKHTPERLWLTQLESAGGGITLKGESLDTGTVADFLRSLNDSPYFRDVDLEKTARGKEVAGVKLVTFVIKAKFVPPAVAAPVATDEKA